MTSTPTRRRSLHGLSTLEALIAGTLMLVSVAGVVSAFSSASNLYAHQRHMTQAISIAELAMEELLLRYRSSPDLSTGAPHQDYFAADGARTTESNAKYIVSWEVAPTRIAGVVRRIDCRVQWRENLFDRHIELFTYRP